jgi:hypothetical protein
VRLGRHPLFDERTHKPARELEMKETNPMQTWAKRGLHTALVTGGLLMLGTGIASADENVNPDTPASPLDLNVTAPIAEANNAVGTPFGQLDLPTGQTELSTKPVSRTANAAAKHLDEASPLSEGSTVLGGKFTPSRNNLKGNKVTGDVVVPIQIVDNAIGVVGDANIDGTDHTQAWHHDKDVKTTGKHSGVAGNAVVLDWASPVQIAGNAGGLAGGSGAVRGGSASQSTSETGDIDTDGSGSSMSGNVLAGQFATPVQVTGNAASYLLGNAYSQYDADSDTTSGGSIKSAGNGGSESGNVIGAPIALPVKFNGNAGGVWGSDADAASNSAADAKAGDTRVGSLGIPTYAETSGDDSFADGNAAVASLSPIANVAGNAASWVGNASTGDALAGRGGDEGQGGSSASTVDSGGFVKTAGDNSAAGGNVLNPSVALPVEAFGIGGSYIGNAHAAHDNAIDANAGNGSWTKGNDAFAGGNIANTQTAGAPEVYGIGASHIGNASGTSAEDKRVTAGAYDGSQGNDSSGSGNVLQVPAALPAEVFGVGGSAIGQGSGSADETKLVSGGGGGSTKDDNGFLSSNLGTAPLSLPVQVANAGAALAGQGHGTGSTDTTSHAGGDVVATGPAGTGAGNIIETPVSLPVLAAGSGAALGGIASGQNDNITDSSAGGHAFTDGRDGMLAGNIVKAPVAGAGTVFSDGVAGAALGHGAGSNDVGSKAGGNATTNGTGGSAAGNVVGADALPVAQAFGDSAGALGASSGTGDNYTDVKNAGDDRTSGVEGALSGNILDLPVTAIPQLFGDAAAVKGVGHGTGHNSLNTKNGGKQATGGTGSSVSGHNLYHAFLTPVQVFGVPFEMVGNATATAGDSTTTDENENPLYPAQGAELAADELPSLAKVIGGLPVAGLRTQGVPALTQGLPAHGLPKLAGLAGNLPAAGLRTQGVPALTGLVRSLPAKGLPRVPAAGLPRVPAAQLPARSLPRLPAQGLPQAPAAQLPAQGLPKVPAVGQPVPDLSRVPAVGQPVQGLPKVPTAGQPAQDLPKVPAVGQPVPALPKVPAAQLPAQGVTQAPAAQLPARVLSQLPVAQLAKQGLGLSNAELPTQILPVVQALPMRVLAAVPATALPVQGLQKLPVSELPTRILPAVPSLTKLATNLPTAGLPTRGLAALPANAPIGAQRADLPVTAPLSGVTENLPGAPALPKAALPNVAALGHVVPGRGTRRADLPAAGLPVAVPPAPALPGAPALPVALPATAVQPKVLPATPVLPVDAKLPVLTSVAPNAQIPALSGLDSTGFLAKLLGLLKRK